MKLKIKLQNIIFIPCMNILFSGCTTVPEYDPALLPETTGKLFSGNAGVITANTSIEGWQIRMV